MQVESQGRVWKWRKWADCEERDFSSGLPLTGLSLEERGSGPQGDVGLAGFVVQWERLE